MGFELLLDSRPRRIPFEVHSWELGGNGGVGYHLLFDHGVRHSVHLVVPLEQDPTPVGEIKCIGSRFGLCVAFDSRDDGIWHRISGEVTTLDLLACSQAKKLVCPL